MTPIEVQDRFGLLPIEVPMWAATLIQLYQKWEGIIRQSSRQIQCGEWLGIFEHL